MATKLWHVPVRLATGAVILDQGLSKLGADEDTAKWLHGQAINAFPQFQDMDPKDFVQLLSAGEIALGTALLGIGVAPSQRGVGLAKDSWMLAIGTALVLDAVFGSRRKRRKPKKKA